MYKKATSLTAEESWFAAREERRVQTGFDAHPASYLTGIVGSLAKIKAAEACR